MRWPTELRGGWIIGRDDGRGLPSPGTGYFCAMTQGKTADRVRGQRGGPPWPGEAGCAVEDFRVRVLALAAELRPLRHALTDWARRTPLRPEQVDSLQLASDEAAANVVEHAYSAGRSGVLR